MTFPLFDVLREESARALATKVGVLIIVNAGKVKEITGLHGTALTSQALAGRNRNSPRADHDRSGCTINSSQDLW